MDSFKILIPTDLSDTLKPVYDFIGLISAGKKMEVTLLHFVEFPVVPGNYMNPQDYLGDLYQQHLEAHREELTRLASGNWFDGVDVNTELVGNPGQASGQGISDYANENNFDLVVLISKHRKGLDNLFPGSELMRVLRNCHVPMLILSPGPPHKINRIAFGTDLSDESANSYGAIKKVADFLGAEIICFNVTTNLDFQDHQEFAEAKERFIRKLGYVDAPEVKNYNAWTPEDGVIQFAEDIIADTIALSTAGNRGISRLLNSSVTEKVLQITTYPVVVINHQK